MPESAFLGTKNGWKPIDSGVTSYLINSNQNLARGFEPQPNQTAPRLQA
jgi:hypothetical protein